MSHCKMEFICTVNGFFCSRQINFNLLLIFVLYFCFSDYRDSSKMHVIKPLFSSKYDKMHSLRRKTLTMKEAFAI